MSCGTTKAWILGVAWSLSHTAGRVHTGASQVQESSITVCKKRSQVHMSCPYTTSAKNTFGNSITVVNATSASQAPTRTKCPKLSCTIVTWSITPLNQISRPMPFNHPIPDQCRSTTQSRWRGTATSRLPAADRFVIL